MPEVPPAALPASEIARVFRDEYGRAVSVLVRSFGDIDLAEEAVQDAFTTAVARWPVTGPPPSPAGWIITSDAVTAAGTDWRQILQLYDQLRSVAPSPVVALNRAVALAEVRGPGEALAVVDSLGLSGYHPFHAVRADLLRRLDRHKEAAAAYEAALARTDNAAERAFLQGRRRSLPPDTPS